jgi:hypothetical protein
MFNEGVNNLCFKRQILQDENTIVDELSNKVHVDLNVFGPLMFHWVARNVYDTLIITPKSGGMIMMNAKLCR